MGRRWGKTVLGGCLALATAAQGGAVAWVVPTYRNGRPLWRWVVQATADLVKAKVVRLNRAERLIEFTNGGFLQIYSMDNPDSIRGEAFHLVILDEAAMIAEEAWTDAIQPTLADHDGDALLISSPKGRNWFWREWVAGQDPTKPEIQSWVAPSSANPSANIQKAARLARERVSERTYRQEWLAEFVEDGGTVFRKVADAATALPEERQSGRTYVGSADWGRTYDPTVFMVGDAEARRMVAMDRFNQTDYPTQLKRFKTMHERYNVAAWLVEYNSMGGPLVELLQAEGYPVIAFHTNSATKPLAVDGLALALEQGQYTILNDEVIIGELQAYEGIKMPSGTMRYSAPPGMHDDTVIGAMLLWLAMQGFEQQDQGFNYGDQYRVEISEY
jgi:phage terminase large subunit-like protein